MLENRLTKHYRMTRMKSDNRKNRRNKINVGDLVKGNVGASHIYSVLEFSSFILKIPSHEMHILNLSGNSIASFACLTCKKPDTKGSAIIANSIVFQ